MTLYKEILIDKELKVNVASNSITNGSLQSTRLETLHLLLELHMQSGPGTSKELVLQVTDESNPLLLLSSTISEGGYQNLKSSQGLLVDFNSFPHHFSELIEKCVEEQQKESPKFVLVLRMSGSEIPTVNDGTVIGKISLEVVELNAFKHLCHLSISLLPASQQTKLAHLSSCIKALKNSLMRQQDTSNEENNNLAQEVQRLKEALDKKSHEVDALKEEMQIKIHFEVEKHNNLLMQEKEINLKCKSDFDRRLARERRDWEGKFGRQIEELRLENSSFKKRNSELAKKNQSLESSFSEFKNKVKDLEEKIRKQTKSLNDLRQERTSWTRDLDRKQELVRKMELQIAHQEKDLQNKSKELRELSKYSEKLEEEKSSLGCSLETSLAKLEKREKSIQHLFMEFQKSLDVLKQFKEKLKVVEKENDSLSELLKSQEVILKEREKEVKKLELGHEEDLKKIAKAEADLEDVKGKLKEALEKIQLQEDSLKSNVNAISWLHKQLNEMESLGAVLKRAPLAEAYLNPQYNINRGKEAEVFVSPIGRNINERKTSTPASNSAQVSGSLRSKMDSLTANDIPYTGIPPIPEEGSSEAFASLDNKPSHGLDPVYLEPSANSLPVRGILRAGALTGRNTKKIEASETNVGWAGRGGRGKTKLRGQNKAMEKKPSAYFSKQTK